MDPAESFSDIILITICAAYAGRDERILCAWRAKIPENLQFFREIFAQISRYLDAGRAFFSDLNKPPTPLGDSATFRDFHSARWPSACSFFCERHAEIPEVLHFFREIFAQILSEYNARRALFRM